MFESLPGFIASKGGQAILIIIIVAFFVLILIPKKEDRGKVDAKVLTISALLVAMGYVLGLFKLFSMPQGGAVTPLSMLPIALCAYILGTRRGVMAGMVLGLLNLLIGGYVIHPVQMLLDYPLAFGAMGLGGIARKSNHGLLKAYLIGILGRYICAFISGVVFFGANAPEKFNAVTWSLWYNFTYIAAEGAITVAVLCVPPVRRALEGLRDKF